MTKKDYVLIAKVFKITNSVEKSYGRWTIVDVAKNLATELEKENPLFNREKFLTACGVIK